MAEAHPVGFRWVMKARERGATIIHVDPRYGRTAAMADLHVPIRAGSDIAFLGGLIRHVLETESYFKEYVLAYTNAATILNERYRDAEDGGGFFSGWDPETHTYDPTTWQYEGGEVAASAGRREHTGDVVRGEHRRGHADDRGAARRHAPAPALRAERPAPPLRALHAGDGRARLRHLRGGLPPRRRRARRATRAVNARPRSPTPSAGPSTPPACR